MRQTIQAGLNEIWARTAQSERTELEKIQQAIEQCGYRCESWGYFHLAVYSGSDRLAGLRCENGAWRYQLAMGIGDRGLEILLQYLVKAIGRVK